MGTQDLYSFGSSVLWGQGNADRNKIHQRVARWVEKKKGLSVRVAQYAHSGAVLLGQAGPGRNRLYGEVPTPWPSIATQVSEARLPKSKNVLILIEGGINGVGVWNIVNPFESASRLRARIRKHCFLELREVLTQIDRKFPDARTLVLGYYQIIASRASAPLVRQFLATNEVVGLRGLDGVGVVGRAIDNCRLFWRESTRHMREAARQVNRTASGSFEFVPSGYRATEGLFGPRSLLFPPTLTDPMADERVVPCTRAIRRGRTGAHCYMAATGHPNARGAARYATSITAVL